MNKGDGGRYLECQWSDGADYKRQLEMLQG